MTAPTDDLAAELRSWLDAERVDDLVQLSGGASRETWAFTADGRPLILQRDRGGNGLRRSSVAGEVAALRAAEAAGVPVASIVAAVDGGFVSERVEGETIARKILREPAFDEARRSFVVQVATAAARLHAADVEALDGLGTETLADRRAEHDACGGGRPAFELAFRWLEQHPLPGRRALVHGDFRLGNVIVGPDGLRAVLDWEMAHVGDPLEDLGFLCVRSWRFGGRQPVAGLGSREELLDAYVAAGGAPFTPAELHRAEVWGTMRWGVIAMQQVHTHLSGAERSIELAAIGRRLSEIEHDLLVLLEEAP